MSFITRLELETHMRNENIDVITRGDVTKVDEAILAAEKQASRYLSRFNVDAIFATTGEGRKEYADLIRYIKDIAKLNLITICNAGVDMETAENGYKAAIAELGKIQSGKVVAINWPLRLEPETASESFSVTSNPKRGNHY